MHRARRGGHRSSAHSSGPAGSGRGLRARTALARCACLSPLPRGPCSSLQPAGSGASAVTSGVQMTCVWDTGWEGTCDDSMGLWGGQPVLRPRGQDPVPSALPPPQQPDPNTESACPQWGEVCSAPPLPSPVPQHPFCPAACAFLPAVLGAQLGAWPSPQRRTELGPKEGTGEVACRSLTPAPSPRDCVQSSL